MTDPIEYLTVHPDNINDIPIEDEPGRHSYRLNLKGYFRLTNKSASLYSVIIHNLGSWGGIKFYNGTGRLIYSMPTAFTGSFNLTGDAEGGIIVKNGHPDDKVATDITVCWLNK